jgi:ABC-2 type transport system permease protein
VFRIEIGKAFRRPRTYVLASLLAGVAVLPTVVLATTHGDSNGPPFFEQLRSNGLFGGLAGVVLIVPFFLPLGAGLLSGESVASEASGGTLRYLLVRPVGRVPGGIAFGYGPLATLSGGEISTMAALARIAAAVVYVAAGVAGLAAIGVFLSTMTESGIGAAAATASLAIVSQILDGLSSLHAIHPYLFTHDWLAFSDLFRSPVAWDAIRHGLALQLCYTAIFLLAAVAVFTRKDVVS